MNARRINVEGKIEATLRRMPTATVDVGMTFADPQDDADVFVYEIECGVALMCTRSGEARSAPLSVACNWQQLDNVAPNARQLAFVA